MKNLKVCMMLLLIISIGTIAQAQQSAFQGTWIGEEHRSRDRLEISGNNWSHFYNNVIQAGGTARFSSGKVQLLLANGEIYFDLTLLAPGLIQQPITMWDGLYRFRLNQQNTPSQNNAPPRQLTNTLITENITIEEIQLTYNLSNSLDEIENAIFIRTGRRINLRNVNWILNTSTSFLSEYDGTYLSYLNERLKEPMNRYNVNYAITTFDDVIVINKRDVNQWYTCIIE